MNKHFEIYVLSDHLLPEHWSRLYTSLASYLGSFSKFELVFSCKDNVVRFFISSDKDLSSLSNSIDGLMLRPIGDLELDLPKSPSKEHFVQFVSGGNLLDLKEKTAVKKSKELEYAIFNIRPIGADKTVIKTNLYFKSNGDRWSVANKLFTAFPAKLLSIDFKNNTHYLKKTIPRYLDIEKSLHMLSAENINGLFEVDSFPYFSHNYYLNLTSYDFDKHSFIIGASGSGKSKFISLFVDRLSKISLSVNYRVVVIDPHASIAEDFASIPNNKVISFGKQDSTDLFPGAGTDLTSATELTATLFKSILGEQFNSRLDRLLRFSLFTLLTAQAMSLENLKRFLTNVEYRNQIMEHVEGYIPQNVTKFFGADYNELRTQYYNETILPLVTMVDEMQLQPSLVGESETSLAKTIQENFLTVFSLNKVSMGDKVVKTVAGLLIQQIFLLAQARAFNEKVILIIDEVSVVQNPTLSQILAEARKFNLIVVLTQQYFGQVDKDLRDAIFSNVYNYYAFKVSEEDARVLEGNLNIELPKELIEEEHKNGLKESDIKIKIMTELHPRECLIRVLSNGQISPAIKGRTLDAPITKTHKPKDLEPTKQVLPEKFKESAPVEKRPIKFSKELIEKITADETAYDDKTSFVSPKRFSNVKDVLAMHSSSRFKVNNKEEDKK